MEKDCDEFVVGFCTKELFAFEPYTTKCNLKHNKDAKTQFNQSTVLIGYETDVYKKYQKIIQECDRKIKNNKILLCALHQGNKQNEKIEYALEKIKNKIEINPTEFSYVKMYADLVKMKKYGNEKFKTMRVCGVCSAIYENEKDGTCGHFMHKAYKDLRVFTEKLNERIVRMSK